MTKNLDENIEEELDDEVDESLIEHLKIVVDKGQAPIRVDKFIQDKIANISRNKVQIAIKTGNLKVNDKIVKPSYKVQPFDVIQIFIQYEEDFHTIQPENLHLDIVYEDEEIIVINKRAGLVVHPGFGNKTGTLVNGLMYLKSSWPEINGNQRPGIVHRLDKDTTGLLVAGKTEFALQFLAKQFFDRTIKREYIALVWGNIEEDHGRVVGNIARNPKNRLKFYVDKDEIQGKWAATNYEVIQRFGYVTLIKCHLETGRTHQIRVHMKYIGHPVFNDVTYGGDKIVFGTIFTKYKQFVNNCFKLQTTQALHAWSIGFVHPTTHQELNFTSELPKGFQETLKKWETYTNELRMSKKFEID
ncbi:MAG: RluA family pseudouridine synthase [Chitinophagales bacterium]|nr:RluA family pseudouridine synthase [Chitinophagales bacterium]